MNEKAKRGEKTEDESQENYLDDNENFFWVPSSSSCYIKDIESIVYGGKSSRFWVFRKHMISLEPEEAMNDSEKPDEYCVFPFFAW